MILGRLLRGAANVDPTPADAGDAVSNPGPARAPTNQSPAPPVPDALWYMPPPASGGYAAILRSSQGVFIFPEHDEGVGRQLREFGAYEGPQMELLARLAAAAQGTAILDIGANIGVAAMVMARAAPAGMVVHAFEPQREIFCMLAGNAALNGLDNLRCHHLALGAGAGAVRVPVLDYRRAARFGSVELDRAAQSDAGQDARDGAFDSVPLSGVDALALGRIGLMKIDVEGMEPQVIAGAAATLARDRPLLYVEHLKCGRESLLGPLAALGYRLFDFADNFVALPAQARCDAIADSLAPYAVTPRQS
jgi:FkbM family methyltransferase